MREVRLDELTEAVVNAEFRLARREAAIAGVEARVPLEVLFD